MSQSVVDPEEKAIQGLGSEFVVILHSLVRGVAIYDANNAVVTRVLDNLTALLKRVAEPVVELRFMDNEFFYNGTLLRVDLSLYERANDLATTFGRLDVGGITFGANVTPANLTELATRTATGLRGGFFSTQDIGPIHLHPREGRSVAALRFQPDRLALYTVDGLVELVDRLRAEHYSGRTPSLLPLKRALLLVIEGMSHHAGVYILYASVQSAMIPFPAPRKDVLGAILAIGFARAIGLDRRDQMTLGLANVLSSLVDDRDPDAAVAELTRYPGVGTAGMPLILAVYDHVAAAPGRPGGLLGQILTLVRAWVSRVTAARAPVSPSALVMRAARGEETLADIDLDRIFVTWIGLHPVGSVVRLEDNSLGVVVRLGAGEGDLPTIARLGADGMPGEMVDLQAPGAPCIVGTPTVQEAAVDLARF